MYKLRIKTRLGIWIAVPCRSITEGQGLANTYDYTQYKIMDDLVVVYSLSHKI